jgi:uncharacterized protein HemX
VDTGTILGAIALLITAATGIGGLVRSRKQSQNESRSVNADEFTTLRTAYKGDLAELQKRFDGLETRLKAAEDKAAESARKAAVAESRAAVAERQVVILSRVLRSLTGQWPADHTPSLDPLDLAELEENTIPSSWLRNNKQGETNV